MNSEMQMSALEQKVQKHSWTAAGLDDLVPAVVAFVIIAIIGAVGILILTSFQANSSVPANGEAFNAIGNGVTALTTIMGFLPLLGLVIIAAAIITVVLLAFRFGGGSSGQRF